ncbi:MAG: heavy metal translocating P-type ATPase [Candidatus Paceibacterota bacterium]
MNHNHQHHESNKPSIVVGKPSPTAGRHAGHHTESFLKKFWVVLALTIPILAYSEIIEKIFGWQAPRFPGYEYAVLFLASIVFFYGGWVFILGAYRELRTKLPGMMTLISLAITAAYSFSVFSVLTGRKETLFWELSTLIAVMLLGHWIEMKAVAGAQGALKELAKFLPDTADVIRPPAGGGKTQTILISELIAGDKVLIRPGSKVPADGVIVEGQSDLNESIITGESKPVGKKIGERVIAGSINGDGGLTVQVDKIGEATFLAGVMRLVAEAQASKSRLQMLSDRAALYLTIIAVLTGAATFVVWLSVKAGVVFATERLVAVLVIACPHALGLAVPLVASISTAMAAKNGLLIKQRLSLEVARTINTVLFDKTGTLTKGEFGVSEIISATSANQEEILAAAGAVNALSEHPLAKAIMKEAERRKILLREVKNFKRIPGKGAQGIVNRETIFVGNIALMQDLQISISNDVKNKIDALSKEGKTINFVAVGNRLLGAIALADIIREESREAVASLRQAGIHTAMITGDSEDVAEWVAKELGIDEYFAKVLPNEKSEKVKALQQKGYKVAMVGDGVNDAPALMQADLGIAIGAGTNVAIESAGIILVKNDPRDIPKIIKLSKLTYAKMIQNLFWATGYNLVALPLAAGALASQGIILQPAVAAALMSASTVIVAFNAVLLRKKIL